MSTISPPPDYRLCSQCGTHRPKALVNEVRVIAPDKSEQIEFWCADGFCARVEK